MYILLGIVMCVIGTIGFFAPEVGWFLESGWKYKNAEPSEFYIVMSKFGGMITAIVGICLIIYQIGSGIGGLGTTHYIGKKFEAANIEQVTYIKDEHISFNAQQIEEFTTLMAHTTLTKCNKSEWGGNWFKELRIVFKDGETGIIEPSDSGTYKFYILEKEEGGMDYYTRTYGKAYILKIPNLNQWLIKNFDKKEVDA